MVANKVEFLFNEKGERTRVLMDIELYEQMLEEIEMAEDIRAYEQAKREPQDFVPRDEAMRRAARGEV